MHLRWPWERDHGITVVYCAICGKFIGSAVPGITKKEGRVFWDYCERCTTSKQGHYVVKNVAELGVH